LIGKAHFQPLSSVPGQFSLESAERVRDLDFWARYHGPYYGFEHVELARNHGDEDLAGQAYGLWLEEKGMSDWRKYFTRSGGALGRSGYTWSLPEELHYTNFVAERTVRAVANSASAGRPFFIWSSFQDPHPPYLTSEPWASMYDP